MCEAVGRARFRSKVLSTAAEAEVAKISRTKPQLKGVTRFAGPESPSCSSTVGRLPIVLRQVCHLLKLSNGGASTSVSSMAS